MLHEQGRLRLQCKSIVETYGPAIFQTISEELDAQTVCPVAYVIARF